MKKSILVLAVILASQITFAEGMKREVVANCNEIIDGNIGDKAKKTLATVKDVQVVEYRSDGPDFNYAIETTGSESDFNIDCKKRPSGLRSKSECSGNDNVIMIKQTKAFLFSEAITTAHYDMYSKQLHITKTESSLSQSVLVDAVLQCK